MMTKKEISSIIISLDNNQFDVYNIMKEIFIDMIIIQSTNNIRYGRIRMYTQNMHKWPFKFTPLCFEIRLT